MSDLTQSIVETKQLTRIYNLDEVTVYGLLDVDFIAYPREIVGITGPSGSGKSTLMNLIGAIDRPTGGTVFSCGLNLQKLSEKDLCSYRRKKVGFIFQFYNLNAALSVKSNIELPMILDGISQKIRHQRVDDLLTTLDMLELRDRPISVLSGGERQRVAVAVALANDPPLILADEPTGELDSTNAERIVLMFKQLKKDFDKTIILVSHDPVVMQVADRVIRLQDGRIVS
ncbi:MAG: ABC transporter ATP-binding protein [Candidatus Hodarchaeales archaeon]|jgi:putative ABC transport system ATP-binding protein